MSIAMQVSELWRVSRLIYECTFIGKRHDQRFAICFCGTMCPARSSPRKFAEQCRKQAGQCKMPGERDSWLEMADQWEAVAKDAATLPGHISQKSKAEGD
jgi:hypothetical protein